MKRILIAALALIFVPLAAAAPAADSAVLLTPQGTLYTITGRSPEEMPQFNSSSRQFLLMTVDNGSTAITTPVPDSLTGGYNGRPAVAYDADSDTLFVFWERSPNPMLRELLLASYHKGKWSSAISMDDKPFRVRYNIGVAVTRTFEEIGKDNETRTLPGLTVHTIWWEDTGAREEARYAMMTVENGNVTAVQTRSLSDFVTATRADAVDADFDREILRHPMLIESPSRSTVDVLFGDVVTSALHRITLKPVSDGRVRIPIGVREGRYAAPRVNLNSSTEVSAVASESGALAIHFTSPDALKYTVFEKGRWSQVRSIRFSSTVNTGVAVDALRRMLDGQ